MAETAKKGGNVKKRDGFNGSVEQKEMGGVGGQKEMRRKGKTEKQQKLKLARRDGLDREERWQKQRNGGEKRGEV